MEPMKTKTLAEIYIKQGHLQEAYDILKDLAEKDPSNREIRQRLAELRNRLDVAHPSDLASPRSPPRSKEEKLQILEGWLSNIQKRRKT